MSQADLKKALEAIIEEELALARVLIRERLAKLLASRTSLGRLPAPSEIFVDKAEIRLRYEGGHQKSFHKTYPLRLFEYLLVHKHICFLDCCRILTSWQDSKHDLLSRLRLFWSNIAKLKAFLMENGIPVTINQVPHMSWSRSIDLSPVGSVKINILESEKICAETEDKLDQVNAEGAAQAVNDAIQRYPKHPSISRLLQKSLVHFADKTPLLPFIPKVVGQLKEESQTIERVSVVMLGRLGKQEREKFEKEITEFSQKVDLERKEVKMLIGGMSFFIEGTPSKEASRSRLENLAALVNYIRSLVGENKEHDAAFEKLCLDDLVRKLIREEYENQLTHPYAVDPLRVKSLILNALHWIITGEEEIAGIDYDLGISEEQFHILLSKQLRKTVNKLKDEYSFGYLSFYEQI